MEFSNPVKLTAQGCLGDQAASLATDPRVHPNLLSELKKYNLHNPSYLRSELQPSSPLEAIIAFISKNEEAIEELYNGLNYDIIQSPTTYPQLEISEEHIPSPDGSQLRILIYRPSLSKSIPLPALVYLHGGGMVILRLDNQMHIKWMESLARSGLVVIAVDFRNALVPGKGLIHPFPAGLDDCAAATQWIDAHRQQLNISKVVLQGESGGANLALATALRAKYEGWLSAIDGVVATVPYISGAYGMPLEWRLRELPSLVECDGYLVSCGTSALNAVLYDPSGKHAQNPLAWPYWASEEDLQGLPPHLIVTNELDPLRDEGNAYYRKLVRAGVRAVGRMNLGMIHVGELFLRKTLPDIFLANLWEIKNFVDRC